MSSVVGDTSELTDQSILVPVVHEITGHRQAFHFKIAEDESILHYLSAFASVKISGPLQFELSAPVTSTVAATASVAVIPDKYDDFPTENSQVRRLEGAVTVKDAILVPTALHVEGKVRQVSTFLSHDTLLDHKPVIVGYLTVAGGNAQSATTLTVHVPLVVSGVAHRKTW